MIEIVQAQLGTIFATPPDAGNMVIVLLTTANGTGASPPEFMLSGLGGTWTRLARNSRPYVSAEMWVCRDPDGVDDTVVPGGGAATGDHVLLYELSGASPTSFGTPVYTSNNLNSSSHVGPLLTPTATTDLLLAQMTSNFAPSSNLTGISDTGGGTWEMIPGWGAQNRAAHMLNPPDLTAKRRSYTFSPGFRYAGIGLVIHELTDPAAFAKFTASSLTPVNVPIASRDATQYIEYNVGVDLTPDDDAVAYIDLNVDDSAPVFIDFIAAAGVASITRGFANGIDALSVDTLGPNEAVFRFYAGRVDTYATLSVPSGHVSMYGLVWTTPSRAAATFQFSPGAVGDAHSALLDDKYGLLAAHTLTLKPLHPDIVPDPNDLLPPERRPVKRVWYTELGTEAGQAPGVHPNWVEVSVPNFNPATEYSEGDVVWHAGHAWIATQDLPTGDPSLTNTNWDKVPNWDSTIAYDPDSHVVLGSQGGGGGGGGGGGDQTPIGRPPGGDTPQVFMRGITHNGTYVWMTDSGANCIIRGHIAPVGSGDALFFWDDYMFIHADNSITSAWDLANYDPEVELRDITWDGEYLWVVRQDTQELLQIRWGDRTLISTLTLANFTPLAIAWDGAKLWVHSVAQSQIVVMERDGTVQFVRQHDWTDDNLSGMGWELPGGAVVVPETIQPGPSKHETHYERNYVEVRRLLAGGT